MNLKAIFRSLLASRSINRSHCAARLSRSSPLMFGCPGPKQGIFVHHCDKLLGIPAALAFEAKMTELKELDIRGTRAPSASAYGSLGIVVGGSMAANRWMWLTTMSSRASWPMYRRTQSRRQDAPPRRNREPVREKKASSICHGVYNFTEELGFRGVAAVVDAWFRPSAEQQPCC